MKAQWLLVMAALVPLAAIGCSKPRYEGGRDTAAAFCDGRFQVLRDGTAVSFFTLVDQKTNKGIAGKVVAWSVEGNWVYFTNYDRELILLDCATEQVQRFAAIQAVPKQHRTAFETLLKTAAEKNPR